MKTDNKQINMSRKTNEDKVDRKKCEGGESKVRCLG